MLRTASPIQQRHCAGFSPASLLGAPKARTYIPLIMKLSVSKPIIHPQSAYVKGLNPYFHRTRYAALQGHRGIQWAGRQATGGKKGGPLGTAARPFVCSGEGLPVRGVDEIGVASLVGGLEVDMAVLGDIDDIPGLAHHHTSIDFDLQRAFDDEIVLVVG